MTEDCKTLEEIVSKAIASALTSEGLRKVVEAKVAAAVPDMMNDALGGWDNPIRKAFKARMQELLVPAIERINLDNARLDVMLNELVSQTSIAERARTLDGFGKLVMADMDCDEVAASEVFKRWCEHVAASYDCDGREVDYDDEPTYALLGCYCEIEKDECPAWSSRQRARMVMEVEDCDEDQSAVINRVLDLWRWTNCPKDEDLWYVHYPPAPDVRKLSHLSDFDIYLSRLGIHSTSIRLDMGGFTKEYVEPDAKPEPDWS